MHPMPSHARLAQSVEHETLNLGVVGSSPTLGDVIFLAIMELWMINCKELPVGNL